MVKKKTSGLNWSLILTPKDPWNYPVEENTMEFELENNPPLRDEWKLDKTLNDQTNGEITNPKSDDSEIFLSANESSTSDSDSDLIEALNEIICSSTLCPEQRHNNEKLSYTDVSDKTSKEHTLDVSIESVENNLEIVAGSSGVGSLPKRGYKDFLDVSKSYLKENIRLNSLYQRRAKGNNNKQLEESTEKKSKPEDVKPKTNKRNYFCYRCITNIQPDASIIVMNKKVSEKFLDLESELATTTKEHSHLKRSSIHHFLGYKNRSDQDQEPSLSVKKHLTEPGNFVTTVNSSRINFSSEQELSTSESMEECGISGCNCHVVYEDSITISLFKSDDELNISTESSCSLETLDTDMLFPEEVNDSYPCSTCGGLLSYECFLIPENCSSMTSSCSGGIVSADLPQDIRKQHILSTIMTELNTKNSVELDTIQSSLKQLCSTNTACRKSTFVLENIDVFQDTKKSNVAAFTFTIGIIIGFYYYGA